MKMQYLRLFPQNNHFFKPQRLVWQEAEPSETAGTEEEPSWEEVLETSDFLEYAKQTCDTAKEEGQEALECRIRSLKEGEEIVKFKRFIDELGEKFLKELPEFKYRAAKETSKRFKLLQEATDMQAIMTRFEEAESYEIVPYRRGKNPAMIIFKYAPDEENPEGATEEYPLEVSFEEKKRIFGGGLGAIRKGLAKRESAGARETERRYTEEEIERLDREVGREREEIIERARYLKTPDDAYRELHRITTYLPNDVLEGLSKPLARWADILSEARIDPTTGDMKMDAADFDMLNALEDKLKIILESYYGAGYWHSMSKEQQRDLEAIGKTFGVG